MPVDTEVRDRVLLITLNRPEKMNAMDAEMNAELNEAWRRLAEDDDIWVAIITGAGDRAFCSGRDLMAGGPGSPEYHHEMAARGEHARTGEREFAPDKIWKPVIAAINGWCLAGGFALALSCDFRLMADSARIGSMAVKRNRVGQQQTARLCRYVPFARALELLMTGDHIPAGEAERIGLVNKVFAPAELMPGALEWAGRLMKGGPLAVRASKEVAYRSLEASWDEAMELESTWHDHLLETEDGLEASLAFKEKRDPVWKAR
jgi:enoyl-CoA hydratase/carnithine racemase